MVSETVCPFCGGMVSGLKAPPGTNRRLSRAAAFAFTATVGATAVPVGCSGETTTPTVVDSGADRGPDGATNLTDGSIDSGVDAGSSTTDSAVDSGPVDSGVDAKEGGPPVPPYGLPAYGLPPVDSGK